MTFDIPAASLRAEIGVDGAEVAGAKLEAFGAKVDQTAAKQVGSFGRIGTAARGLNGELASFGLPFTGASGRVLTQLERMEGGASSFGSTLSNLGRTEATIAVVGLAAVATEGVHLADSLETAHARLEVATKNAGQQWSAYSGQIKATDKSMESLGFTNADTESSLARLEQRTHDLVKAQGDEKIAADIAAGSHRSLDAATTILVQTEAGRYTQLSRLGIASKEQIKGFTDTQQAVDFLARTYAGQASAAADTFAAKEKVLGAQLQDFGATIGEAVVPKLLTLAHDTVSAVQAFESFNSMTGGAAGKALALGAAIPIAVYAYDKLQAVTSVVIGTFGRLAGATATEEAAATTAAAANTELAGSEAAVGAAASTAAPMVAALFGEVAAGLYVWKSFQNAQHGGKELIPGMNDLLDKIPILGKYMPVASHATSDLGTADNTTAKYQQILNQALEQGRIAAEKAANGANTGAYAYLGLASSVKSAAAAMAGIIGQATGAGSPYKLQLDTNAAQASADALHGKIDAAASAGGGGGGGSGQTATAAALDRVQKELAVRDALRQVGTTENSIRTAEEQLTQARGQSATANQALIVAENAYRNVLHGVAADTTLARNALDALTSARNASESQALNVKDAERALQQAQNDSATNAQQASAAVTAAEAQLASDRANGADVATITKDEAALADARLNVGAVAEAVQKAEIALSDARLTAKQKTTDLNSAEVTYNGTLHGFAANSTEAKAAQDALRTAQQNSRQAADALRGAQQTLQGAQDQTATSALNLARQEADLNGQLTAHAGAGGGMSKLESTAGGLITKLDDLRTKSIQVAQDVAVNIANATGNIGAGDLAFIRSLQLAVQNEPLLAGSFDSVIASLTRSYNTWVAHAPIQSIIGQNVSTYHPTYSGASSTDSLRTHAAGGTMRPGEWGTAGEAGTEVLHALPGGGVQVFSHAQSTSSGGDIVSAINGLRADLRRLRVIHVDHVGGTPEQLARTLDAHDQRERMLAYLGS